MLLERRDIDGKVSTTVLILIVMEDALRATVLSTGGRTGSCVLILIVMEDALRDLGHNAFTKKLVGS